MNQTIRCESLPFIKANGEAAAEVPLCTEAIPEGETDFSDLLKAELGDVPADAEAEAEGRQKNESDALAVYGVAPFLVQPASIEIVQLKCGKAPDALAQPKDERIQLQAGLEPGLGECETKPPEVQVRDRYQDFPVTGAQKPDFQSVGESSEKIVPSPPAELPPPEEQISGKGAEPAKKSNGMVVAQRPLMLMTSQRDEKALETGPKAGLEHFEAPAFEQAIRIEPIQGRLSRGEKADVPDVFALEGELHQTPRFEVISGEMEVQRVRSVEPVTLAEEIRTHVELLKSSTAEKLDLILRPDAQTELRLQVEKVNGQIQVQVRCDRGDFTALEAHWGTVQNTLAPQGIRVEPLQQGGGTQLHQNGSNSSQNSFGQHSNEREERPPVFIEQEFGNREAIRPKSSRGSAGRGWQSWA